jgi:hypothetical protein
LFSLIQNSSDTTNLVDLQSLTPEEERQLKLRAQQKRALLRKQAGHDRTPIHVADRLYIGAGAAAKNLKALRKTGITHILNASMVVPCYFKDNPEGAFQYATVPVFDDEDTDLKAYMDSAVAFIHAGRRAGGVLVHCCAGQSRSAALIMAYLIAKAGMDVGAAWSTVRRARPCAHPNQGFLRQLQQYEHEVRFKEALSDGMMDSSLCQRLQTACHLEASGVAAADETASEEDVLVAEY